MKRDLIQLTSKTYDLLVIGGGIHGACVAYDAALRGLSVALIDKGDFGHATSANSLKTVHGGLRYLQDADIKLVRLMIHERKTYLRIAPHLVHPMSCLMPTYNKPFMKSRAVLGAALLLNDLMGFDRNRLADPQKHLPNGQVISKEACLGILPGLADNGITGGAIWHDAQIRNTERMTLSFVLSAVQGGAQAANYVEAVGFLKNEDRITGVRGRDVLTGQTFDIQARMMVNTAGPWIEQVLDLLSSRSPARRFKPSIALNLVTRQIVPDYAMGIPSHYDFKNGKALPLKKPRMLFVAPWRNYSIAGTVHLPYNGCVDTRAVTEQHIWNFVNELNAAYPGADLNREDVYFVHQGFLPAEPNGRSDKVKLVRQAQIYDYQKENGLDGLITVVGVKYTTARNVAQQAVDLVFKKLDKSVPSCLTAQTPICGGQIERFSDFLAGAVKRHSEQLNAKVIQHLVYNYGSAYPEVLKYLDESPQWGELVSDQAHVIKAEILYGIHKEMAQKLSDVILRRTDLGSAGPPDEACLQTCADIMATELGWDKYRREQEINQVRAVYMIPDERVIS